MPDKVDDLLARAAANGWKAGAHRENDTVRDQGKHVKKTIKDHDRTLSRYVLFRLATMRKEHTSVDTPLPDEALARSTYLQEGIEAPDLATMKDFTRFYIATSRPSIDDKPTVDY